LTASSHPPEASGALPPKDRFGRRQAARYRNQPSGTCTTKRCRPLRNFSSGCIVQCRFARANSQSRKPQNVKGDTENSECRVFRAFHCFHPSRAGCPPLKTKKGNNKLPRTSGLRAQSCGLANNTRSFMQSSGSFRFGLFVLAVFLLIASAAYPESRRPSRENGFICGTGPSRQRAALARDRYQESALQERQRGRGP